jgi:WD40 repeat protein
MSSACSSSDDRPLVLVSAPLGPFAGAATKVEVTVSLGTVAHAESLLARDYGSGNVGIYLPAGSRGDASVTVGVTDASACTIASGTSATPVRVAPGERTSVVSITLVAATGPCGSRVDGGLDLDASSLEVATNPGAPIDGLAWLDAGALDGPRVDLGGVDLGPPTEARPETPYIPDAPSIPDAPVDAFRAAPDAALEAVVRADLPLNRELGAEASTDAPPSTSELLSHCTTYQHSATASAGGITYLTVSRILFTPDRKVVISFGNDGRAKVWNVTPAGLSTPASGLEFSGSHWLYGAIRPDGQFLAVGDADGIVMLYDLPASIASGVPVRTATLSWEGLPRRGGKARPRGFTTDGNRLVVSYSSYAEGDANQVALWDLSAQAVARQFDTNNDQDYPMAYLPGDEATSLWFATEETVSTETGYDSVVTLIDMAKTPMSKAQFTVPGVDASAMAFSPDGRTLAIGAGDGEVSLWNLDDKNLVAKVGTPIAGGAAGNTWANAITYSADGKYLAAVLGGDVDYSVVLAPVGSTRQSLSRPLEGDGFSIDIASDGLALAVGEADRGVIVYCTP